MITNRNLSKEASYDEENFYKCHFCEQNIDRYDIENHFVTIHKFKETKEKSNHVEAKLKSFEDGKSKFLHFMTNFESEKDALSLYYWIKSETLEVLKLFVQDNLKNCNETALNNQEIVHEFPIVDDNISPERFQVVEDNNGIPKFDQEASSETFLSKQQEILEEVPSVDENLRQETFQLQEEQKIEGNNFVSNSDEEISIDDSFLALQQENFQGDNSTKVPSFQVSGQETFPDIVNYEDFDEENEDPHKSDLNALLDYALDSENEDLDTNKQDSSKKDLNSEKKFGGEILDPQQVSSDDDEEQEEVIFLLQ